MEEAESSHIKNNFLISTHRALCLMDMSDLYIETVICATQVSEHTIYERELQVEDIPLCYIIKYTIYVVTVKHNYLLCL